MDTPTTRQEDLLQKRLEQLEAGVPLEDCLTGLPAEEAALLQLVVRLKEVEYAAIDDEVVTTQRAALMQLVGRSNGVAARVGEATKSKLLAALAALRLWWHTSPASSRALAAGLAAIFLILLVGGIVNWTASDTNVASVSSPADREDRDDADRSSSETASNLDHSIFIPSVASALIANPQTAVLDNPQGIVEVQDSDGKWTAVSKVRTLAAGQRVRTGKLSGATLTFYDGSQADLGPNTEISIDRLNARLPEDGSRIIVLTQWLGDSDHRVASRQDGNSRYEVNTPSGTGVAKGTEFHVLVTLDLTGSFTVNEGVVAVTNLEVTVLVIAGQTTIIQSEDVPSEPGFVVTGEGEVTAIGDTWTIAGQQFAVVDSTIITGDPQVGDMVFVSGHLLPDGTMVADQITLLSSPPQNQFSLIGTVDSMSATEWMVAGQSIAVDETTEIDEAIEDGDIVRVEGVIMEDGVLSAQRISLVDDEDEDGLPFEFTGVVQESGEDTWTISGVTVAVDDDTEIKDDIVNGDVVKVEGWIIEDGRWLAHEIKLAAEDEVGKFEFTGTVENMDPWLVAGISFATDDATEIDADIEVGDLVHVEGHIANDGSWVAAEIKLVDDDAPFIVEFVGTVTSIDPWQVNGILLEVDADTMIGDDIEEGDLVWVKATILPDGTWLALEINLLPEDGGIGCLTVTAVVTAVNGDEIVLEGWPAIVLDDDVEIEGDITANSVISIVLCVDEDGTITIISIIIVIQYEPPPPIDDEGNNNRVTLCHKPDTPAEKTMTLPESALSGHLNHGDTLGACD